MGFSRFYCPGELGANQEVELPEQAAHHASRVLRLKAGEQVTLFNGAGGEYPASIVSIGKHGVAVHTGAWVNYECESPLDITLVQAISSGDKMDFTLQKAVELGVKFIQPVISSRSVVRLEGERAEKRVQHWQNVVNSACEQSGRNRVPEVGQILSLNQWFGQSHEAAVKLTLSPHAARRFRELPTPAGNVLFLVGPEGGLTDTEEGAAAVCGFTSVKLGERILRTETAALAAISAMQTLWGDF